MPTMLDDGHDGRKVEQGVGDRSLKLSRRCCAGSVSQIRSGANAMGKGATEMSFDICRPLQGERPPRGRAATAAEPIVGNGPSDDDGATACGPVSVFHPGRLP